MNKYFVLLFGIITNFVFAQEKTLSLADATIGYWKGLYPEQLQGLTWMDNEDIFVYQKEGSLIFKNTENAVVRKISLQDFQAVFPNMNRLPYAFNLVTNSTLVFQDEQGFSLFDYTQKKMETIALPETAKNMEFNYNAKAVAYTLDNNLYLAKPSEKQLPITAFSNKNIVTGQAIARSEYGITKGTFWSPEGNYLAFYQKDETAVKEYPLVDITTYPASPMPIKYPMAGGGSEVAKVGVYNLKTKKTVYLNIDTSDNHYLTNLSWSPDEKYILLAEINRATTSYKLNRYNATNGELVNTILTESNNKWVEPQYAAVFLPNSTQDFLWLSQKDGFMNLYLYSSKGKLKKQLTHFDWVVTDILGFSSDGKYVFAQGTGKDARESHTFKISLKTGKFTNLNTTPGTHYDQLSPKGDFVLDNYSSISVPGVTQLINTKTDKKTLLLKSPNPLKNYKIGTSELVDLTSNDGQVLHGVLMKPADFDPHKKYPVLVYVYGGPHAQLVTNSYLAGASLWLPAFATLNNYLVFTLDNRGSANRGFEFESVIHQHLGDNEIEDQLRGIDYLKTLAYVNANRIAVNGWSFGGFMTTSLMLRHPGIFTTAVAGGPVTDWKYYEVMYGERYMDTPQENPEGYEKARVGKYIKNLDGKMLIITGSVDPTVVPQNSMTLLKDAVDNNVQIDFFSYPMHEHNVRGMDRIHLIEKMADYIVRNNQ